MKIELPIFGITKLTEQESSEGQIDLDKWNYDFEGKPIDLDVNFNKVSKLYVEKVSTALSELSEIHQLGLEAVHTDFAEGTVVKEYIEEWLEDGFDQLFDETEFQEFIENTAKEKGIKERLLSLIRIVRIGIYAESDNSFVTMDFAFGYDSETGFRDDMIVVKLDPALQVTEICTEG